MRKHRIVAGAIAVAAVVTPVAGLTAIAATPAGAAVSGIKCSALSGKANTTTGADSIKVSSCTGKTGGSGTSKGHITDTTATINWVNGKKTSITESYASGSGCPSGSTTEVISGNVTSDNTGSTAVGAPVSATVCAKPSATNPAVIKLTLLKGTQFVIGA